MPDPVRDLHIEAHGTTYVLLKWLPPEEPNGHLLGYDIGYQPGLCYKEGCNFFFLPTFTLAMLNRLRCHSHFEFSANQITSFRKLIQSHILNDKQYRFRSVGFFRSQLIWISTECTECKSRAYLCSAGPGLSCTYSNYSNLPQSWEAILLFPHAQYSCCKHFDQLCPTEIGLQLGKACYPCSWEG